MKAEEFMLKLARDAGAVYPVIGDCSGEPCVVDTEDGTVYRLGLRKVTNRRNPVKSILLRKGWGYTDGGAK